MNFMNRGGGFLSSVPPVTKNLIIINALVMVMTALDNSDFMYETFALFYPTSPFFKPWQLVTHMFMHGGFFHLFFNMYTLYIFGVVLERVWGEKKFLIYYFVTGLGAAALHMFTQYIQMQIYMADFAEGSASAVSAIHALKMTPTVGASGAVYGVLLGFAMLYPDTILSFIFPPVQVKAKWAIIIFAVIALVLGITGGGSIAHFAHLGGMLFGWLLILYWRWNKKRKNKARIYRYE